MIRAVRRSRFASLLTVLALLAALPASLAGWHEDWDDPLCVPVLVVHDHGAHQIGPDPTPRSEPEHCLVCHWFQLLRGATVASRFLLPAAPTALLSRIVVVALTSTSTPGRSGRAPPVS